MSFNLYAARSRAQCTLPRYYLSTLSANNQLTALSTAQSGHLAISGLPSRQSQSGGLPLLTAAQAGASGQATALPLPWPLAVGLQPPAVRQTAWR